MNDNKRTWDVYSEKMSATGEPRGLIHFADAASGECPCRTPLSGLYEWGINADRVSADVLRWPGASICQVCNDARADVIP